MKIPGRILVVDDQRGEVTDLLSEFMKRGEHAIYSDIPVDNDYYNNVRVLVADYFLDEDDESRSIAIINDVINNIVKKAPFLLVIVWSAKATTVELKKAYRRRIFAAYKKKYKEKLPCMLIGPVCKGELNYSGLLEKVDEEISKNKDIQLLFEIEKIIDKARDEVNLKVYEIGNWSNVINGFKEEYDVNSSGRLILSTYLNFLKREAEATEQLKVCAKNFSWSRRTIDDRNFGRIYSAQYYFEIKDNEQIGCGDIFIEESTGNYFMVINPECDMTHQKQTKTKLLEALRIEHTKMMEQSYFKKIAKALELSESNGAVVTLKILDALKYRSKLKENYYPILFLRCGDDFYHLVFDFNKVKYVEKACNVSDLPGYKRIVRVDTPLLSSLLQKYGAYCARTGTLSVPKGVFNEITKAFPKTIKREAQPKAPKKVT